MDTLKKVTEIINETIEGRVEVEPGSHLADDLGIGSFDSLMLINAIEDEFSIKVDDSDFKDLNTVNDIVKKLTDKYL